LDEEERAYSKLPRFVPPQLVQRWNRHRSNINGGLPLGTRGGQPIPIEENGSKD